MQSLCSSWYARYPWLHYQEASDTVLRFHCHVAERRNLLMTMNKDKSFTTLGFSNWKKAIESFSKHKRSIAHQQAVDLVENIPRTIKDVGDMLSSTYAEHKTERREMLKLY